MKDFIAYQLSEDNYNDICREYLEDESEDRIKNENKKTYDRAYAVICFLIEKQIVCNLTDMEKLLIPVNKSIFINLRRNSKTKQLQKVCNVYIK